MAIGEPKLRDCAGSRRGPWIQLERRLKRLDRPLGVVLRRLNLPFKERRVCRRWVGGSCGFDSRERLVELALRDQKTRPNEERRQVPRVVRQDGVHSLVGRPLFAQRIEHSGEAQSRGVGERKLGDERAELAFGVSQPSL